MADLKIRAIFEGAQAARGFFGSIAGDADAAAKALNSLGRTNISQQLGILPQFANRGNVGASGIKTLTVALDGYNNVLKQTSINAIKLGNGELLPISEFTSYTGNVEHLTDALKTYTSGISAVKTTSANFKSELAEINTLLERQKVVLSAPITASQNRIAALRNSALPQINTQIEQARLLVGPQAPFLDTAQQTFDRNKLLNPLLQQRQQIISALGSETANLARQEKIYQNSFVSDPVLTDLRLRAAALEKNTVLAYRAAGAQARAGLAGVSAAYNEVPSTLPTNLRYLQQISPNLYQTLRKAGLGGIGGTPQEVYAQNAQISAPRADLVRGTTKFSGEFTKEMKGGIPVIQEFSAEIDKNGKVVTRFGGQLSGASQVLKQITRDFQKVIEWTVATTLVFGALQYTISQLNNLKELDFALQKFAITAQKSPEQAQVSFGKLAQIAHDTATPLLEIIGAADDIALATQKAGQSTEEWDREILSLTSSVGVFTNLTGVDTVQATDLLTATMKQLKLTAADIPAILSKITAVAGGQSQAIADITKGLSVMAQAGKVANLTIDQQIATVQVLSQVTSKTPAEVATAFKNLVGSLGSPAALKGLEQFNIKVREQNGELVNILDVYKEISDKIKSGIIPTGEVQGLIRAISGGPRRAPDAAALLAAIDQIYTAQRKSEQATNEATITNAKAIDTTKAKFIQLQSAIDAVTFEKFGGQFKTFIGSFTKFITTLLEAFNKIPSGVIAAGIQIGIFFIAVRVGARAVAGLGAFLIENIKNFLRLAGAIDTATVAQLANNAASAGSRGPILGPNGQPISSAPQAASRFAGLAGLAGRVGAGALVGGTIIAATGGSGLQILGGVLQGAGIAGLTYLPGIAKLIGVAAIGIGTFLTFTQGIKDNTAAQEENAIAVLNSYSNYKDALSSLEALNTAQDKLSESIDTLSKKNNKNNEDQGLLLSNQQEYTKNTLDIITATIQLNDARKELLANEDPLAKAAIEEIINYKATGVELDKLILKYQKIVLTRAGLKIPTQTLPDFNTRPGGVPTTGSTNANITYPTNFPPTGEIPLFLPDTHEGSLDLKTLATDASRVKDLFNETGTEVTATFDITRENINLVNDAIVTLGESNPELAKTLQETATAFFAQNDAVTELNNNLAAYQAYIDVLSLINPTQSAEFQKLANFVNLVKSSVNAGVASTNVPGTDERGNQGVDLQREAAQFLKDSLKNQAIDYARLKEIGLDYYNSLDPKVKQNLDANQFLLQLFHDMESALKAFGIAGNEAFSEVTDEAKAAGEALETTGAQLQQGVVDRLVQIQSDLQAGLISPEAAAKSRAGLLKYLEDIKKTTDLFSNSLKLDPGFGATLEAVQPLFTEIIGLENAASLSGDTFIGTLLRLGDTYGLNGKQLLDLGTKLITFYNLVNELNKLRVKIPVSLDVDSIKRQITILLRSLASSGTNPLTWVNNPITRQILELSKALDLIGKIDTASTDINKLLLNGKPLGSSPKGSGTKSGLDVSELDLPKEIASASNANELIKQAIANAKKLQSQIPGATKEAKNDLVVILDGLTKVMQVSGIKNEYLRKALEDLAAVEQKRLDFETKADIIRRIRVGAGDFSAIANVPVNSTSGVSLGGANGPINVTLNLNGTVLTPAQLAQFADLVASALKRQIAGG